MTREKKKILNYRINTTLNKLKSPKETNNFKKFELFNIIPKTGNSIYSPLFEEQELIVMKQLELLRYSFDSMECFVSKEVNKTFE